MITTMLAEARDGVVTQARHAGFSGEAIIFVHGVGSTAEIWDAQLRAFERSHRCFAIDLRGNGARPDPPLETVSREGFARDVLAIADAAQANRFHFVGCSLGGVVAFELWKQAPQRVASYCIVGSFAKYAGGQTYADTVIADARKAGSMEVFTRARMAKLGLPPGKRADESFAQMACKSLDAYAASTQATWTGDYRALLPSITVPTLVAIGERDTVAPLHFSQEIADAIPSARLEVLPNAGHVANADAPDAFNALLGDFLSRA